MPDNPVVSDLITHATKVTAAQVKLREAMAQVAAEIKATPPPAPEPGKPA